MARKIDKSGTLSEILKGNFSEVFTFARLGELAIANLVMGIVKGVIQLDKLQTQYNKSFGFTDTQAAAVQSRMSQIASDSGRTSINFMDTHKTMEGIANATGLFAGTMRADVIEEATELQKLVGLSDEGMARLAFNAQVTGQNMEEQSLSMVNGVSLVNQQLGLNIKQNDVLKEVSETSGAIRANFGRNVEALASATAKAKAFGLTLKDLEGVSKNLLNFQSSIEAELTAELFIGRQLNLERARLFALTGDLAGVQDEIIKNLGSEFDFLAMNVMQREKFAAAMGMTSDQLSDLIFKEGDIEAIRARALETQNEDVLNQLKARDLAQSMADIMTKVQTTFVEIAEGPIGALASSLGSALASADGLKTILTLVAGVKIAGLIGSIFTLGGALGASTVAGSFLVGTLTLGVGLAIAAVAAASFLGKMNAEKKKMQMNVQRFNTLGDTEMATLERGSAIFDAGETVVRTDNFSKLTDRIDTLIGVTEKQKLSFNVETHHQTRYR